MHNSTYHLLKRRRHDQPYMAARLRLVLFGFAGGSITALLSLTEQLPTWIEVWGAEYPGRGLRWQSPLRQTVEPLLADLAPGLQSLRGLPIALLGYSMGAHIAYRLALSSAVTPLGVIAASARPPCTQVTDWPTQGCSDAELIARMQSLGGIPAEILSNQVVMQNFLPVARADLACCRDLNGLPAFSLHCPLLVLHGKADQMTCNDPLRWLQVAGGRPERSACLSYPGGHFFHRDLEQAVAHDITNWLSGLLADADAESFGDQHPAQPGTAVPQL